MASVSSGHIPAILGALFFLLRVTDFQAHFALSLPGLYHLQRVLVPSREN